MFQEFISYPLWKIHSYIFKHCLSLILSLFYLNDRFSHSMQWVSCFPQRLYLWIPCDAFFRIISSSVSELILHLFIGFLILGNPVFDVFIFIFNAFIFPSNLAFSNNIIYLFICNYYFSAYLLDAFKSSDFAVSLDCSFVSNSWELVPLMNVIVKTALW